MASGDAAERRENNALRLCLQARTAERAGETGGALKQRLRLRSGPDPSPLLSRCQSRLTLTNCFPEELEAKDATPAATEDGAALSKRPGFSGTLELPCSRTGTRSEFFPSATARVQS